MSVHNPTPLTSNTAGASSQQFHLHFTLRSDATFGRGAGMVGMVDREVDYDADGLPLLRGRTLKGLLNESVADILYALRNIWGDSSPLLQRWQVAAARLFGGPGSDINSQAYMDYRDATLPPALRAVIHYELYQSEVKKIKGERILQPSHFLNALTAIRRQTAMNALGVPVAASLRSQRVVLRETSFVADLCYTPHPQATALSASDADQADDLALLAAAIKGWERAGSGRNRGLGRLKASLQNVVGDEITEKHFEHFTRSLQENQA